MRRACLALLLWLAAGGPAAAEIRGEAVEPPRPVAAFSLQDQDGRPFTADRLRQRWSLVLLGYTSCPDVCPFTLSNLVAVLEEMSLRTMPDKLPQVVFVAADPARDAPLLKEYVTHFHPDIVGVTGPEPEVDRAVAALDGVVERLTPDKDGFYTVNHSAAVAVVDPAGHLVAKLYPPMEPAAAAIYLLGLARGAKP